MVQTTDSRGARDRSQSERQVLGLQDSGQQYMAGASHRAFAGIMDAVQVHDVESGELGVTMRHGAGP